MSRILSRPASACISALLSLLLIFPAHVYASTSDDEIKKLGNVVRVYVAHDVVFFEDTAVTRKVRSILARLLGANNIGSAAAYDFRIINETMANAFSGPYGMIYLTTGLLQTLNSDSEVALILAHEIAHHQAGDFFGQFDSRYGKQQAKVIGGTILMAVLIVATAGAAAGATGAMGTATTSSTLITSAGAGITTTAGSSVMASPDIAKRTRLKFAKTNPKRDVAHHSIYAPALLSALTHSIYEGYPSETELSAERKAVSYLQKAGFQVGVAGQLRARVIAMLGEVRPTHFSVYISNPGGAE